MLHKRARINCLVLISTVLLPTVFQANFVPVWSQSPNTNDSNSAQFVIAGEIMIEEELRNARELRDRDEFESAIALYHRILAQDPQHREAREGLALTYAYNQERQKSIHLYQELIAEEPQNLDLQLQLAMVTSWEGDHREAISLYEKILIQDPSNIQAKLGRAEVMSWAGRHRHSIRAYEAILEQDPNNLQARLGRAQVLSWAGRRKDSIRAYEAILEQDPNNLQAKLGQAQVTAWNNQHSRSLQLYNEILEQHPDSIEALRGRAEVTLWSRQRQEAISLYQQALEQFPNAPELRLGLARIYQSQQKISEALELLQPLIDSENREALQITKDIQGVQSTTTFRSNSDNFGQASQSIQQTVRFRINNSNTIQQIGTGVRSFEQNNYENLTNIPLEFGIEGRVEQASVKVLAGADFFDRLDTVPRLSAEVNGEILPNVNLALTAEYGAYKSNVQTLENEITALQIGPTVYWQIDRNTGLFSFYRWGAYNDGNNEQQFLLKLERQINNFFVSGSLFNWSYKEDPQNGYFAPPDFLVYTGEVGWEDNLFDPLRCRVSASLGRQRLLDEFTNANAYQARCTAKFSSDFEASLGYIYSNVRDQNTGRSGFNSDTVTGEIRFIF